MSGFQVCSSERLWKKLAERLMVGRKPGFAVPQPALSQFPVENALCSGAKNQSSSEWTDFLHGLASGWAAFYPECATCLPSGINGVGWRRPRARPQTFGGRARVFASRLFGEAVYAGDASPHNANLGCGLRRVAAYPCFCACAIIALAISTVSCMCSTGTTLVS